MAAISPSVGLALGKKFILKQDQELLPLSFYFRKPYDFAVRYWWLRRKVSLQRKMLNSVQGGGQLAG